MITAFRVDVITAIGPLPPHGFYEAFLLPAVARCFKRGKKWWMPSWSKPPQNYRRG